MNILAIVARAKYTRRRMRKLAQWLPAWRPWWEGV